MSAKKDLNEIIRRAEKQGFTIEDRRSGHLAFRAPDGRVYFTGGSPSDHRVARKLEQELGRHLGYVGKKGQPKK